MPTNTFVALETKTLGSAVSSVTFDVSSYTGYDNLQIVFDGGISTASSNTYIRFNGDTGSNYCMQYYEGRQGGAAATGKFVSVNALQLDYYGGPSTTQSMFVVDIYSFRKTGNYRPVISRYGDVTNSTYSGVGYTDGLWLNNSNAITSIQIYPGSGNWNSGSTFTLYGYAASNYGAKATGGAVYSDATYFYHVFGQSGTFTPTQSLSADVLVVAGGGGGGVDDGGGGGAGGVAIQTARSLSATGYSITVGAGGAAGNGTNNQGSSGSPSSFDTISTTGGGGGGGGSASPYNGVTGGSGGGGSYRGTGGTGTTGTSGGATLYGNSGGNSSGSAPYPCGGGGGAGGAGVTGTGSVGGNGGVGLSNALITTIGAATGAGEVVGGTWYIAGGGGGSVADNGTGCIGGSGGGGIGQVGSRISAVSGKPNSGGGGGAGVSAAGNGGSGVVIIRYARA